MRQYQKEVKKIEETGVEYVEVDLIDIEIANHLMNEIMKNRYPLREDTSLALKAINELVDEKVNINNTLKADVMFTRKELSAFSHLSDNVIRTVLDELVEAKYVEVVAGSKGKTMLYRIAKDIDLVKPCEFKVTRLENHNNS